MNDKFAPLDACYVNAAKRNDEHQQNLLEQAIAESQYAARPTPPMLTAALWYASHGLHVFPLRPGQKDPLKGSRGFKDATTDEQTIQPWFWNGNHNIGVAAGHHYDVIDIDGQEGIESFLELTKDGADWLIVRAVCETPRGLHLWVPPVAGAHCQTGWMPGIDYRTIGGYVVVPPSQLYGQPVDGPYRWLLPPIL